MTTPDNAVREGTPWDTHSKGSGKANATTNVSRAAPLENPRCHRHYLQKCGVVGVNGRPAAHHAGLDSATANAIACSAPVVAHRSRCSHAWTDSFVQLMAVGVSGDRGNTAVKLAAGGQRNGRDDAIAPHLALAGNHVRAMTQTLWSVTIRNVQSTVCGARGRRSHLVVVHVGGAP